MILLMTLGCFLSDGDPMCDAICNEQYAYDFSKSLDVYDLAVSFKTDEGEETVEVSFDGETTSGYAQIAEVEVRVEADGVSISASYGTFLSDIVFTINDVSLTPSFVSSEPFEVCGSECTTSMFDLNTDSVEEREAEITMLEDLEELISCANSTEDFTIVARNESRTHALIIQEPEGYYAQGGYWENGAFNPENLTIELHRGVNVGVNYCTDAFLEEDIQEVFVPIDPSDAPPNTEADEVVEFSYGPNFPECEGCPPIAILHVENFWFQSDQGNYAKVELINYLQCEILLNYGG